MQDTNVKAKAVPQKVEKHPVKKVLIICARGTLEDVYASLVMANGALMEGMEAKMFFTFFGLEAIRKGHSDHLHTATVGNPAFMPKMPTMLAGLPGFEAFASSMMKREMEKLDIPLVSEFFEIIDASGGEIYACKLAADMFHLKKEDFINEVKDVITVGQMYALAEGNRPRLFLYKMARQKERSFHKLGGFLKSPWNWPIENETMNMLS